ncbi:MAG: hypothetical protein KGH64_06445 [Candidatus Micrarchaeota archaeon]|nr:hypothetical protein [Candidatus Micrarchaeota archaeon]MDE1834945.1 hypothetical protein [Candidatus Micrarchaeota archaeon]MDE1860027.1 hypothetical protein [Candidatus Micrarchaeota archaeon]
MIAVFGYLVFLGALGSLAGALAYIRSMMKGDAKPNRVTWLMWAVAPLIATAAELASNVGLAVIPVFISGFSPLLIFLASFRVKGAYWKLTRFDYACGIMSALAIVLWAVTDVPDVAILFSIASDGLAAVPTIKKSWTHPQTESVWVYVFGMFSSLSAFGVISSWTFSAYAFPVYMAILNLFIIFEINYRNKYALSNK